MAGQRMRKPEPLDDATEAEAPASTPTESADTVQSPNARRVPLTERRKPGASGMARGPALPEKAEQAVSDFVSRLGNELAAKQDISLDDLIRSRPAPERDLVQCGYRLPRYVREAVRLVALARHVPEQDIVTRAILADPDLKRALEKTYQRASE